MTTPFRVLILEDRRADAQLILRVLRKAGFDPEGEIVATEADFLAHLHPNLGASRADVFDHFRAVHRVERIIIEWKRPGNVQEEVDSPVGR